MRFGALVGLLRKGVGGERLGRGAESWLGVVDSEAPG